MEIEKARIEEFNPIDGQFFLITKSRKLLGQAWDLESARIIAAAFDRVYEIPQPPYFDREKRATGRCYNRISENKKCRAVYPVKIKK